MPTLIEVVSVDQYLDNVGIGTEEEKHKDLQNARTQQVVLESIAQRIDSPSHNGR